MEPPKVEIRKPGWYFAWWAPETRGDRTEGPFASDRIAYEERRKVQRKYNQVICYLPFEVRA